MNSLIFDNLKKLERSNIDHILPHQFGAIDYIYKQIINEKKNILIYHQMGTGKTIISLITSFFISKQGKNVYFLLPSKQVKELWINTIDVIRKFVPKANYEIGKFTFETKKEFIKFVESEKKEILQNKFLNTVFVIDEVHNLLNNSGSENLLKIQNMYKNNPDRPLFILISGSPITNTILTFKDLYSILTYKTINLTDYSISNGPHIYNHSLTENGKKIIKEDLNGLISYFFFDKSNIPPVIYVGDSLINTKVTKCKMSQLQFENYEKIRKSINNEMFLKYLLDSSLTTLKSVEIIKNFEELTHTNKEYKITNDLYIQNGKFKGEELTHLNNSCKIKYFVDEKINKKEDRKKSFIYFSNARIGGRFLKDVMRAQGVKEYGTRDLPNFVCYNCGRDHTCKICKPLTYIMITSIFITSMNKNEDENKIGSHINFLLDRFNSSFNENGEEIYFLFGSKIISESFTLKEVRDMWFLTIPYSISEYDQIVARCIRNFSYKDIKKPVYIHTLVSVFPNDNNSYYIHDNNIIQKINTNEKEDKITKYIEKLENNSDYSYDIKKVLYLEIKSLQTKYIYDSFIKASVNISEPPHKDLLKMYVMEIFKFKLYSKKIIHFEEIFNELSNLNITEEYLNETLTEFLKDGLIVKTQRFKNCFITRLKNTFYTMPIILESRKKIYNIPI